MHAGDEALAHTGSRDEDHTHLRQGQPETLQCRQVSSEIQLTALLRTWHHVTLLCPFVAFLDWVSEEHVSV